MTEINDSKDVTTQTAEIVAAFVSHNTVPTADLPNLIGTVYASLTGLGHTAVAVPTEAIKPAVPVRKSIMPDYLVCLEDGKKLKMLKRHLHSTYGMSPDEYRTKWGLPHDYPMVAPNYSEQRSSLAKKLGLGTNRTQPVTTAAARRGAAGGNRRSNRTGSQATA